MSLSVGKTCSKPYCGTQDFLPIKCNSCQATFCREHIPIGIGHECQGTTAGEGRAAGAEGTWVVRKKCELKGCEKPSLDSAAHADGSMATAGIPAVCDSCGGAFCVSHREPKAHKCVPTTVATEDKNARAKALLAKAFPGSAAAGSAPSGSGSSEAKGMPSEEPKVKDAAKEARLRKVELMKMRHQAVPLEPQFAKAGATVPPLDKRLFFKARAEGGSGNAVAYWVSKEVMAGKVADRLATVLKVPQTSGYKLEVQGANVEMSRKVVELSGRLSAVVEDGDTVVVVAVGI